MLLGTPGSVRSAAHMHQAPEAAATGALLPVSQLRYGRVAVALLDQVNSCAHVCYRVVVGCRAVDRPRLLRRWAFERG